LRLGSGSARPDAGSDVGQEILPTQWNRNTTERGPHLRGIVKGKEGKVRSKRERRKTIRRKLPQAQTKIRRTRPDLPKTLTRGEGGFGSCPEPDKRGIRKKQGVVWNSRTVEGNQGRLRADQGRIGVEFRVVKTPMAPQGFERVKSSKNVNHGPEEKAWLGSTGAKGRLATKSLADQVAGVKPLWPIGTEQKKVGEEGDTT